jgi:nicotinamidase-related amidase
MLSASKDMHEHGSGIIEGTKGAELISDFGPKPEDIVIPRLHGLTPFTSTSLDQTIRNLGATSVIPIGVSINIGILGLVLSAVDLGYQVVIPTDAIAGVPLEYGEMLLDGTLSLLSTLTTTASIIKNWE